MIIIVVFLHVFLNVMSIFSKKFLNYFHLKRSEKYLYVSYMVACFNSTLAIVSSYHGLFFTCKGGNAPLNNIFTNDECMMDLDISQKYGLTMIAAYFTYDFLYCLLIIRNNDKLMLQTYMHHVLGLIGSYSSIHLGSFIGNTGHCTLLTEFSTLFVNFRVFLAYHDWKDNPVYMFNGFMILFSFLIFRMLFQGYVIFFKLIPFWLANQELPGMSDLENKSMVVCIILYIAMYGLNCVWFDRIVKGFIKVVWSSERSKIKEI